MRAGCTPAALRSSWGGAAFTSQGACSSSGTGRTPPTGAVTRAAASNKAGEERSELSSRCSAVVKLVIAPGAASKSNGSVSAEPRPIHLHSFWSACPLGMPSPPHSELASYLLATRKSGLVCRLCPFKYLRFELARPVGGGAATRAHGGATRTSGSSTAARMQTWCMPTVERLFGRLRSPV